MAEVERDRRLDPRLERFLSAFPNTQQGDVASRDDLLAETNTPEAVASREQITAMLDLLDDENIAPKAGLDVATVEITSEPDGNPIKLQVIRPEGDAPLPCVYYIHGGGMASMSCFDGMYRSWGRIIASKGVAVVMVDFRNCVVPSSCPEVAPFPAGLNDCVSGLKWVHAHASELGIDAHRIIVAGESGGGNLTLATGLKLLRDGDLGLVRGLYALCPYIAGSWPQDRFPSSIENNGILLDLHNNRGADRIRHRGARAPGSARVAVVRDGGRRRRARAHRDQRQRVRPAARRGHRVLPAAPARRCAGPVPAGDGHDARYRGLLDRVSRHQPCHRCEHRPLLSQRLTDLVGQRGVYRMRIRS